jgi:hypothetical protein
MKFKFKENEEFKPIDAGIHRAVLVGGFDLGSQYNERYLTTSAKVVLMWELADLTIKRNGQDAPRVISKMYTNSMHEKANLRRDLESWSGTQFNDRQAQQVDSSDYLGRSCQLQIIHFRRSDGKTAAKVQTVLPCKDEIKPVTPIREYSIEENGINIPEGTPEWIVKLIEKSDEWEELQHHTYREEGNNSDDIPF